MNGFVKQKRLSLLLLAIWFGVMGLSNLFSLSFSGFSTVMSILMLAICGLLLMDR